MSKLIIVNSQENCSESYYAVLCTYHVVSQYLTVLRKNFNLDSLETC